jgi:hypothetical protein
MSRRILTPSIETATADQLRAWLKQAHADIAARREDARIGWWMQNHPTAITLTMRDGSTITTTPDGLRDAIDAYHERLDRESRLRSA